jgi:hypothetical protein
MHLIEVKMGANKLDSGDVVFFFGAGASAPFGIPTMKQFVVDFEDFLNENADKKERELYSDIKKTLETKIHRKVDLEAVFSVIDGIITYDNPEQLGMLALYFEKERKKETATGVQVETCKKLKAKFQNFIKEKCVIPETFDKIYSVYHDFFNRIAKELGAYTGNRNYYYHPNWIMFTTNYDVCLECFWRTKVHARLDTNFQHDDKLNRNVLRPNSILATPSGIIKLFKLHGSINWLIDEETGDVIEVSEKGQSFMGTTYAGEMMVYPIAEKELYIEPYISMLVRLNRELRERQVWIVVGYSFNEIVIKEIFRRNWTKNKRLVLIHPEAKQILNRQLSGIKGVPLEKYFGITESEAVPGTKKVNYRKVNHQLIHKLGITPKIPWNRNP